MIPAVLTVFSKLDGQRRFVVPLLPAPPNRRVYRSVEPLREQNKLEQSGSGRGAGAVEVRISCVGGDRAVGVDSLSDWLRGEPELARRLRVAGPMPGEGELGALADVLVIAVGSGGTLSVLAASLKAWLAQPRGSDVRIRVQHDGGETIEIDAKRIDGERADTLIRQALGGRVSGE